MSNIVITVLSLTIGFFFILIGSLKLSPAISEDVYREMRKVFIRSAKKFPMAEMTGWTPDPHVFRKVVGTTEVVSGILLAIIPGPLKQVANIVLLTMMVGGVYIHYALGDPMNKMTPSLIFSLLLGCRFIVFLQVRAREKRLEKQRLAMEAAADQSEQELVTAEDKKTQ